MSSVGERAHTALQRAGGRAVRTGRAARRAAARGRPAHRAVRAALLRGRRLLAVGLLAPLLGGRSSVMVMALLVLSIGIFPPRTSLWSASKSTTHVVRARNAGFCKSWANSCARTGDLDGARHRVALSLDGAPPHSEGSRATRPDAPIGRSRPSAAPNRRVQGPECSWVRATKNRTDRKY